jgi:hypothetical protein
MSGFFVPKSERELRLEKELADLKSELSELRTGRRRYSHFATQMREVVEAAGGRMLKEDYLSALHQRIISDGGSTSVRVLSKTATTTPKMQRARICKVVIGPTEGESEQTWEIWVAEAAEALKAGDYLLVGLSLDRWEDEA